MFSTPDIVSYSKYSAKINKKYAERHGYDFKHIVKEYKERHPCWAKVESVRKLLMEYENIFWIDSDAFFFDHSKLLPVNKEHSLTIGSDNGNGYCIANSGTFMVTRTVETTRLFDEWYDLRNEPRFEKPPWDQIALHEILQRELSFVKVLPTRKINSHAWRLKKHDYNEQFIVHYMATSFETRVTLIKKWWMVLRLLYSERVFKQNKKSKLLHDGKAFTLKTKNLHIALSLSQEAAYIWQLFYNPMTIKSAQEQLVKDFSLTPLVAKKNIEDTLKYLLFHDVIVCTR